MLSLTIASAYWPGTFPLQITYINLRFSIVSSTTTTLIKLTLLHIFYVTLFTYFTLQPAIRTPTLCGNKDCSYFQDWTEPACLFSSRANICMSFHTFAGFFIAMDRKCRWCCSRNIAKMCVQKTVSRIQFSTYSTFQNS